MADAKDLREFIRNNPPGPFQPGVPIYSKPGDFICIYWKNEDCYSVRVGNSLVLYRSFATDEVCGVKQDGVEEITMDAT